MFRNLKVIDRKKADRGGQKERSQRGEGEIQKPRFAHVMSTRDWFPLRITGAMA